MNLLLLVRVYAGARAPCSMVMNYLQQELPVSRYSWTRVKEHSVPGSAHPVPILGSKSVRDLSGLVFDRDRDRDCSSKSGIRLWNENRRSILRSKSLIEFHKKTGIRIYAPSVIAVKNRFSIAARFAEENRGLIFTKRSGSDPAIKIGSQFFRICFWLRSWSRLQF